MSSTPQTNVGKKAVVDGKVVVLLKNVGNAPILKQKKFRVRADDRFIKVQMFLRKQIAARLKEGEEVHYYIQSAFSPAPNEVIRNLANCFHTDGQLIIEYAMMPTWG